MGFWDWLFDNPKSQDNQIAKDLKQKLGRQPTDNEIQQEKNNRSTGNLTSGGNPSNYNPNANVGPYTPGSSQTQSNSSPFANTQGARPQASSPVATGGGSPFANPATQDKTSINDALNVLNNPYVSSPNAQNNASSVLQKFGINAGPNFPQQNPYDKLYQNLMDQIQSIQVQQTPYDQLKAMADSQVNAQYDPVINSLQGEMNRTQTRADENKMDIRSMYGALGDNANAQAAQMQQSNQVAQDQTNKQYDQAAQQMQQSYQNVAGQQQNIMSQLGLQAAGADPRLQQNDADKAYFQNQQAADHQHQIDALQQIGQADQGYQHNIATNSQMAGENQAQLLTRQLQDYMGQAQDKMVGLQQQKGLDATNILNQLYMNDLNRVQNQGQMAFQRAMDMNNFQLNAMNANNSNQMAQQDLLAKLKMIDARWGQGSKANTMGTQSGMGGVDHFLAQQYGNDNNGTAAKLQQLLGQTLNSPEVIQGKVKGKDAQGADTMYNMTDEYVMQQLRNLAQQQGLNGVDVNNLMDSYLAYKGNLR
jgi:hypothetical protein